MSFIFEVFIFADFLFSGLKRLIVTASGHISEHFLVFIRKIRREVSLLRVALDFPPLSVNDGLRGVV